MRRWNGWGDESIAIKPSAALRDLVAEAVGAGQPSRDVAFEAVCAAVPPSRLAAHPLISTEPAARARHACGQSLPDLIALRGGAGLVFPDGLARPASATEVSALLAFALEHGASVIPFGGGTSVTGHVNPMADGPPVLTMDLSRLSRLLHLDAESRLATFEPGVCGPELERQLAAHGYRLGHYPQSFEYSTLGGWIATRSSGQQSHGYGRIEDLFAGGTVVTPAGMLRLPPFPASAAGPDLRQVVLGSEGRLGILTEAIMRISPMPEAELFEAVFFPGWDGALSAARTLAQSGATFSMLRLSTPAETTTNIALSGPTPAAAALETVLHKRGLSRGTRCMAVVGFSGTARQVRAARAEAFEVLRVGGGVRVAGARLGHAWQEGRFRAPYLRNTLWEEGYAVDTVETATTWARIPRTLQAVEAALGGALAGENERVHAFTHLSHVYGTGASLYTTFVFRAAAGPEATRERWQRIKRSASEAIVAEGATISHQHGVGADHAAYLPAEKGELGMRALRAVVGAFDQRGLLNPGKLMRDD